MAEEQELHESVQRFKQFMQEHPHLISEVNKGNKSLQSLYEEWAVLGEQHEQWTPFRKSEGPYTNSETAQDQTKSSEPSQSATDTMGQIMSMIKRMDVADLQNHLSQFSSMLSNVQNVIQTFQKPDTQSNRSSEDHPFSFRRD